MIKHTSLRARLRLLQDLHAPRLRELGVEYSEDLDSDSWVMRARDGRWARIRNRDWASADDPTQLVIDALRTIGVDA